MKSRLTLAALGLWSAGFAVWFAHAKNVPWFVIAFAGALLCIMLSVFPAAPLGPKKPQRPPGDK